MENGTRHSLARIPLRWMIRECFRTHTGIQFEADKLYEFGIDPHSLYPKVLPRGVLESEKKTLPDTLPRAPPLAQSISSPREVARTMNISMDATLVGHDSKEADGEESRTSTDSGSGTIVKKRETTLVEETLEITQESIGKDRESHEQERPKEEQHHHQQGEHCSWSRKMCDENLEDIKDAKTKLYDQLKLKKYWWILEYLPFRARVYQTNGTMKTKWM